MHGGLTPPPPLPGEDAVFAALDRRLSRDIAAPVAVALSGGGDSLALLRWSERWARGAGRPLLALTVDHKLHPDSAAWTAFAAARAAESGAAFRALSWEGEKPATGLPAAARAARHALLAVAAREAGASVILLGHTADDVAETDLMRTGDAGGIGRLREWSPSPSWPQGRGVMLLRPMLEVHRADLRRRLGEQGEVWLDDPANDDARYARVRARTELRAHPAAAATEDDDPNADAIALSGQVQDAGEGGLRLPLADLCRSPSAAHVVSVALLCAGGGTRPPRRAEIDRLLDRLRADAFRPSTLCGARIEVVGGMAIFRREPGDRRRNPRCDIDGVIDGRFVETADGPAHLAYDRFRAATFQIGREADTSLNTSASA